jgi:hypothetical protein
MLVCTFAPNMGKEMGGGCVTILRHPTVEQDQSLCEHRKIYVLSPCLYLDSFRLIISFSEGLIG